MFPIAMSSKTASIGTESAPPRTDPIRKIPTAASVRRILVFSFKRLCEEDRGASDYLAIARAYHTVVVVGIPKMGPACSIKTGHKRPNSKDSKVPDTAPVTRLATRSGPITVAPEVQP